MDVVGLVLAAGDGWSRRRLAGDPLVVHAARALRASGVVGRLVVVTPPDAADVPAELGATVVAGAGSRHGSLHCGLPALGSAEVVVVHDACRPLVPADVVVRVVDAVRAGADLAVPVVEVTETVKELDAAGWITGTVPRETVVRVQGPRAVRRAVLDAVHRDCPPAAGDDGEWLAGGVRAVAVAGAAAAFAVLDEPDLELAAAILAGRPPAAQDAG